MTALFNTENQRAADGERLGLVTAGTALSRMQLELPDTVAPVHRAVDSTDLVRYYALPRAACPVRLTLGNLAAIVEEIRSGRAPREIRAALWCAADGTPEYLPPPLGENGGCGVPNQVAVAAMLRAGALKTALDGLRSQAARRARSGTAAELPQLNALFACVARTTGRSIVLKLAELLAQPGTTPDRPSLLHVDLPGLPEVDDRTREASLAGGAALLLEMSAIEQERRRPGGSFTVRWQGRAAAHSDAGADAADALDLLSFPRGIADYITLMEPGAAGIADEVATIAWHSGLVELLAIIDPNTAAHALLQRMQVWGEATSRVSPLGFPAMFAAVGYAVVELDIAAEAKWLALCDAEILLTQALARSAAGLSLQSLEAVSAQPLDQVVAWVIDPRNEAEAEVRVPFDAADSREALSRRIEAITRADGQGEGGVAVLQSRKSPAQEAALSWVCNALEALARGAYFAVAHLIDSLPGELRQLADTYEQSALEQHDAARERIAAQLDAVRDLERDPRALREAQDRLEESVPEFVRELRLAARDQEIATALRGTATQLRDTAQGPCSPAAIVAALQTELRLGTTAGAQQRLAASTNAGRSPVHRTLLDGAGRVRLYQRQQKALAPAGSPRLDLLAEIAAEQGIYGMLLRRLSPDPASRMAASNQQRPSDVAGAIVACVVEGLSSRHQRELERCQTVADVLDQVGLPDESQRDLLIELHNWAWEAARPPVMLNDAALAGVPEPVRHGFIEADPHTCDALAGVLAGGVERRHGGAPGTGPRLVIIRDVVGLTLDLLQTFSPGGAGWDAYLARQEAWEGRVPGATPVHTFEPLEAMSTSLARSARWRC
jgi:hypothetical protein